MQEIHASPRAAASGSGSSVPAQLHHLYRRSRRHFEAPRPSPGLCTTPDNQHFQKARQYPILSCIIILCSKYGSQSDSSYGNGGQVDIVPRGPSPPQQRERAEGVSNIGLVAIDEISFQTSEPLPCISLGDGAVFAFASKFSMAASGENQAINAIPTQHTPRSRPPSRLPVGANTF